MTHLAEVHTIYETNCRSIPGMLRQAADNLEIEEAEGYDKTNLRAASHAFCDFVNRIA